MTHQNHKPEMNRQHAENDFEINVKAELAIKLLHQKIMSHEGAGAAGANPGRAQSVESVGGAVRTDGVARAVWVKFSPQRT